MKLAICILSTVVVGMFLAPPADASILEGSVSFDAGAGLYTYSYVLNNISGPAALTEINILVNNQVQNFGIKPQAHTDPPGAHFVVAVAGTSADPPLNEFGTFWAWEDFTLPVGNTAAGFSFTTAAPPAPGSANNYFLYATTYSGGPNQSGIVEYGHVVAPQVIPEPGTLGVAGSVLAILCCRRRRQARMRAAFTV